MRDRALFTLIGGFAAGVMLRSFFDLGSAFVLFLFALGALVALLCAFGHTERSSLLAAFFLVSVGLGIVRLDARETTLRTHDLARHIGEEIQIEGRIVDEPDEREASTKLTVNVESIGSRAAKGSILLTTNVHPRYEYGERLSITGILQEPGTFETDDGSYFDYGSYLRTRGITHVMYRPALERVGEGEGNKIAAGLFAIKQAFLESVGRILPEPQAGLLNGLLLGVKKALPEDVTEMFQRVGIIHIVVLSGYNITIVAQSLMWTVSFLPRAVGLSVGAFSIVLFAIISGGSATAIRAALMALLVVLARATGRTYQITRALIIAGFVMLIVNPALLVFDTSFQLSFLATVGLIHLSPYFSKMFRFLPERLGIREIAASTVATQLIVLPLLLHSIPYLSFVALPANLLVLIIVPITMLFGFLAGAVGIFSSLLALPFAYISNALLSYILALASLLDAGAFTGSTIPRLSAGVVLTIYAFMFTAFMYLRKRKPAP